MQFPADATNLRFLQSVEQARQQPGRKRPEGTDRSDPTAWSSGGGGHNFCARAHSVSLPERGRNRYTETLRAHSLPSRQNLEPFSESETNGNHEHQRQQKANCTEPHYSAKTTSFADVSGRGAHVVSLVHLRYTAMPGEHALHQRIAGRFDLRVHKRCYLLKLGQARQYLAAKRHHGVLREGERGFATHHPSRPNPISRQPL